MYILKICQTWTRFNTNWWQACHKPIRHRHNLSHTTFKKCSSKSACLSSQSGIMASYFPLNYSGRVLYVLTCWTNYECKSIKTFETIHVVGVNLLSKGMMLDNKQTSYTKLLTLLFCWMFNYGCRINMFLSILEQQMDPIFWPN